MALDESLSVVSSIPSRKRAAPVLAALLGIKRAKGLARRKREEEGRARYAPTSHFIRLP